MKIWNCEPKKGVDLWIHLHILLLFNGVTAATIQQVIKKFFRVQQKQPKECLSSFFFKYIFQLPPSYLSSSQKSFHLSQFFNPIQDYELRRRSRIF